MKSLGLITFLAGLAVGGTAALLLAPKSGKETRRQMGAAAEKAAEKIKQMKEQAVHCAEERFNSHLSSDEEVMAAAATAQDSRRRSAPAN